MGGSAATPIARKRTLPAAPMPIAKVLVKPNSWVNAGDVIGTLGISGRKKNAATRHDSHIPTEVLATDVTNPDGTIRSAALPGSLRADPVSWAKTPIDVWYRGSIAGQPAPETGESGRSSVTQQWYEGNLLPPAGEHSN